jgi:hypothetical protein
MAKKIVNRLRIGLFSLSIDLDNDKQLNITASFGIAKIATNIPLYGNIDRAGEALYAAKHGGRNQAIVYEEIKPDLKNGRRKTKKSYSLYGRHLQFNTIKLWCGFIPLRNSISMDTGA